MASSISIEKLIEGTKLTPTAPDSGGPLPFKYVLDGLIESFPGPVLVVDTDGVITYWNEAIGGDARDPSGGSDREAGYDIVGTDGKPETVAETVVRTGETVREDKIRSGTDSDGNRWHIWAKCVPLKDDGGTVVCSKSRRL